MATLEMPRLTGSRLSARQLAEQLPATTMGDCVVLDARQMEAASQSFADELVVQVFVNRAASTFEVIEPTQRFARHLLVSAQNLGYADRLKLVARL